MIDNCSSLLRRFVIAITGRNDLDAASFTSFVCFLLTAATLGYAYILVTPLTGFDHYTYFLAQGYGDKLFDILRGVWLFNLENQYLPALGISPYVSALAYVAFLVLTVLLVVSLWAEESFFTGYDKAVGLLLLFFPYWVSQMYFPYFHYGYALCNFLAVSAIALVWHSSSPLRFSLGLLLYVAGVGHYQGAVNTAASIGIATCLLALTRTALSGSSIKHVLVRAIRCFCLMALGSVAYILLHKAVLVLVGMQNLIQAGYAVMFDVNFLQRLWIFKQALFGSPFLLPGSVNTAYLGLLILVVLLCFRHARKAWTLLLVPPLLAIAVFAPSVLALVQPSALYPRSIVGAAVLWACVFFMVDALSGKRLRLPLSLLAAFLVVCFFIRINYAWHIQELTVQQDKILAMQINERLEKLPQSAETPRPLPVSIIGCLSADKQPWPTDYDTMFGHSQFTCFGERTITAHASAMLRFAGGEVALIPPRAHDLERVAGREPWPGADSVFIDGYGFGVWLGGPAAKSRSAVSPGLAALARAFGIADQAYLQGAKSLRLTGDEWLYACAVTGNGPWPAEIPLVNTLGHIDSQTALPDDPRFMRITGWAFDLVHKQLPERVIIIDDKGQVIGFAATGGERPDLVKNICPDAFYGGFTGYMLTGAVPAGFRYPK